MAYHLQRAGDERAAAWLVRAGERAEDAYALVTAAERYEAAMKLLDAQQGDPAERGWVRLLAAALRRHDDRDRAFEWVEEVVRLAAAAGDPSLGARAQAFLGLLLGYGGDYAPPSRLSPPRRIWLTGCLRGRAPLAAANNGSTRSPTAAR